MTIPHAGLRGRDIHEKHRVSTPLELLFDLTFVVAISQAASQLHHGVVEHHVTQALPGYLVAFAAAWWAWMNYTWFASAYDNDDTLFRVLTLVQMGGVLVLATGIPGLFTGHFRAGVIGYVVMRLSHVGAIDHDRPQIGSQREGRGQVDGVQRPQAPWLQPGGRAAAKSVTSRHAAVPEQAVLCDFITEGHFGRHVRRMREVYAERLAGGGITGTSICTAT
ncbi:MAG TPA: low temperature requirement protein A, partial [Thermoanaerobaculia bacterium]|nr:low temperature requirement protein A [Thermoanaerobaculia bacterium]